MLRFLRPARKRDAGRVLTVSNIWLRQGSGCAKIDRKKEVRMKKGDIILILLILLAAAASFGAYAFFAGSGGAEAVVYIDGEEEGRYSLKKEQTIELNGGTNTLVIRDGSASMERADCPDQICVRHRAISKNGESIICLPHEIVVTIEDGKEAETDAVVQ